ncbi:MAG: hypothetical protein H7Z43_13625 [Clostridia bacterium]|nr:hypothetical protein [Deltaproteobacteria bacterium]
MHGFAHELMHMLDVACGRREQISSSPKFTAMYKHVQASGRCNWPGGYALATSAELFAEAGCCYLGLQGFGMADSETLREHQQALYVFMDDFFRQRLPRALSRKSVHLTANFENVAQRPTFPVKSEACIRVLEELESSNVFDARQRASLVAAIAEADHAAVTLADVVATTTYTWFVPPAYVTAKAYVALVGAYEAVKGFTRHLGGERDS